MAAVGRVAALGVAVAVVGAAEAVDAADSSQPGVAALAVVVHPAIVLTCVLDLRDGSCHNPMGVAVRMVHDHALVEGTGIAASEVLVLYAEVAAAEAVVPYHTSKVYGSGVLEPHVSRDVVVKVARRSLVVPVLETAYARKHRCPLAAVVAAFARSEEGRRCDHY